MVDLGLLIVEMEEEFMVEKGGRLRGGEFGDLVRGRKSII